MRPSLIAAALLASPSPATVDIDTVLVDLNYRTGYWPPSRTRLRIAGKAKTAGSKLQKLAKRHACGVPNPSKLITKFDSHTKAWKIYTLVA